MFRKLILAALLFPLSACQAGIAAPAAPRVTPAAPHVTREPPHLTLETPRVTPETPTPTLHPAFTALQEQIAASSETFTLNQNGEIEMWTADGGRQTVPNLQVHPDGTMTFTHNGEERQVDTATLTIEDQTITFKDENGKTWVFDGEDWQEEIREFVPAETIEFSETLRKYDLVLAPDADLKAIYWDIAVVHLGDAISKSPGLEANRKVYEEIIKDHPEWEGIGHGADYKVRLAFMKEFLTRTGGRMIVTDMSWNKYEADFNQPVKFEAIEVDGLPGGRFANLFTDQDGKLVYRVSVTTLSIDRSQADISPTWISIYFIWKWTVGGYISNLFRATISEKAFKDKDSDKHNYKLYTRGGVPKSGAFYKDVYWTFIKNK